MTQAIVRAATSGEIERAAAIAMIAFETEKIDQWIESYNCIADNAGLEYIVVVEADGEIVASLICTPGAVRFTDDIVPFSSVGCVATLPEQRQHGYAGMMMSESVRILHRNGYHTSALWPFSYSYYRKFGWEVGAEARKYRVPCELASTLAEPKNMRPALKNDLPAIAGLVDRFARRYNCVTIRDEFWQKCRYIPSECRFDGNNNINESKCPWVHETSGEIDGYVDFKVVRREDDAYIRIAEIITETPNARNVILSKLATIDVPNIIFLAPMDDGFPQELPNPKAVKVEVEAGFQFRVVNPLAALELRSVDPDIKGLFGFTVSDPVLGVTDFDVEIIDGKISKVNTRAKERLSISIQTFSQLYCGYVSPSRAAELSRVEATSDKAINFADGLFKTVLPFRSYVEYG